MKIVEARLFRQWQPFADGPYTCRGQTEEGFDSCIVALSAEDGTVGWGEAAPLGAFYAEAFPEGMAAGIQRLLPEVIGLSATAPARLSDALDEAMLGQPAVKSAIDMAAWDLASKLAGVSMADFLGGLSDGPIHLYRSVSQADPATMAAKAKEFVARDYRRLQVKVGADPLEDVERIRAVRAAVPANVPLYADANGGWLVEDALRFVDMTRDIDYRLEQPCMTHAENMQVARRCAKPMVLDEGVSGFQDLLAAHQDGIVSGVTLKIARIGGVTRTCLIRDAAIALGLSVTIEDTGGSTINTAATAQLMTSTPVRNRAHTVDFMNWVTVQNAQDMPQTRDGMLLVPDGPGLGVRVDPALLGKPVFRTEI